MAAEQDRMLTPAHLSGERRAIASSCCGFTGEAVLTESAVIMLFAGMLGAGEALKLLTTAVFPFLSGLLMLPMAYLAMRKSCRKMTVWATLVAATAYILTVFAPYCGEYKVAVLLFLLVTFAVSLSGFVAGWFPLLDTFLLPERRTGFIGRMRFMHQLSAVAFLTVSGFILGKNPSMKALQIVIAIAGVIFIGRAIFIALIPGVPEEKSSTCSWRGGIVTAWNNKKLRSGAFYLALLNLAVYGITPLWIINLQQHGQSDNVLVYISAAALSGMMLGYLSVGKIAVRDHRKMLGILQKTLLVISIILLLLPVSGTAAAVAVGITLMAYNFTVALTSVSATALMMDSATAGNKTMAMALFGALGNGGMGSSRVAAALLIHSPLAAMTADWKYCNIFQAALIISIILLLILSAVEIRRRRNQAV